MPFIAGLRLIYPLICLILSVFVVLTIVAEFWRGGRVIAARSGINMLAAMGQLTMRNTRRYGGYVVHFGMVLIFIGIAGSAFNPDVQQEMPPGAHMKLGPYDIVSQNFDQVQTPNYQSERATLEVFRNGKSQMILYPERRFFLASQITQTLVGIQSTPLRDIYLVYDGRNPETNRPESSRLFESAGEMHLVRRVGRRARHNSRPDSQPPAGPGGFASRRRHALSAPQAVPCRNP